LAPSVKGIQIDSKQSGNVKGPPERRRCVHSNLLVIGNADAIIMSIHLLIRIFLYLFEHHCVLVVFTEILNKEMQKVQEKQHSVSEW